MQEPYLAKVAVAGSSPVSRSKLGKRIINSNYPLSVILTRGRRQVHSHASRIPLRYLLTLRGDVGWLIHMLLVSRSATFLLYAGVLANSQLFH